MRKLVALFVFFLLMSLVGYYFIGFVNARKLGVTARVVEPEKENISIEKQEISKFSKKLGLESLALSSKKTEVILYIVLVIFILLIVYIIIKLRRKNGQTIFCSRC